MRTLVIDGFVATSQFVVAVNVSASRGPTSWGSFVTVSRITSAAARPKALPPGTVLSAIAVRRSVRRFTSRPLLGSFERPRHAGAPVDGGWMVSRCARP